MKYWVYHEGEVPGNYEPHELARLPGFSAASLVCPADSASGDRRWQRAGLYPDIVEAMRLNDLQPPPVAPAQTAAYVDPSAATGPDELLNATSHRIFMHVTELMKELENRREEQALAQSLQRTLVDLKGELHAARERIRFLDDRVSTIPALEERERRAVDEAERVRGEYRVFDDKLRERELRIAQLDTRVQEAALALDNALRAQADAMREQRRLAQVVEDLNRQLASKESSLAKSLAMIRRLESELAHLLPQTAATMAAPAAKAPAATQPPPPPPPPAVESVPALVVAAASAPPPVPDIPKLAPQPLEKPVIKERVPEVLPVVEDAQPPVPKTSDDPKPIPAADGKVEPVPPPWQSALAEVTAFLKRNLPKGPPEKP
ncbi:MAG: hypothetical protein HY925_07450 [Elusimicrobia bacterium]|nr:hypothetical protein [Elusimicrobiota bacterium]